MKASANPHQMVAEDEDIRGMTLSIMRHHFLGWPDEGPSGAPFFIHNANGGNQALEMLPEVFKQPGITVVCLVVDAENDFAGRARGILDIAIRLGFQNVPNTWPKDGLRVSDARGRIFGAWILPDNESHGMVETLCVAMMPNGSAALWDHAVEATLIAKETHGATYSEAHATKARLYAWLAWQATPGERIQWAIGKGYLNAASDVVSGYVAWCDALYGLQRKP